MQQINEVTRHFCWHQNFVPSWLSASAHENLLYKIRLQRDFLKLATNDRSDKMFLLTSKFRPQGVVSPCPWAIYVYKIMKKMYKIRLQRIVFFFKLEANDRSDKRFLLTSKVVPWGCLPLICGCTYLLNHENMCIKSDTEVILFKLATNDHSDEAFLLT